MKLQKPSTETAILLVLYILIFLYLIFQDPIFSPDSYSYLKAMPQRNAGYVIFGKFFKSLLPLDYPTVIVMVQLIFGLFAVHVFYRKISEFLNLSIPIKILLLIGLIVPFFPPLWVANNICSEGLSYPLYLLLIVSGVQFLFEEKKYTLLSFSIIYVLLVLTRGQFIVTSVLFAMVYFFKYRKDILKKSHLLKFSLLLVVFPLMTNLVDKTYHKIKDGLFISTPYKYVNMSGSAFYVSKKQNILDIENPEHQFIFEKVHDSLYKKGLLQISKKRDGYDDYYQHYHNNVPQICNQTVHNVSRDYYFNKFLENKSDKNAASAWSLWQSELACRDIYFVLVKNNWRDWSLLYVNNILHGFKSWIVLIFVIFVMVFSVYKLIKNYNFKYAILFLFSSLTLANALIVALATYSIVRLLFYNYVLMFLMIVALFQLLFGRKTINIEI